ncbi:MAG: ComF family protein [Minisyncoccia bacterium]
MNLNLIKESILNLLFPKFCLGCKKEGTFICEDCLSTIEISEYTFCPFCEKPNRTFLGKTCKKHRNFYLNGLFSATSFQNNLVKTLIYNFKYEPFLKELAKPLSFLIISHFLLSKNEIVFKNSNSLILPIPLHISRLKFRGFNQSELIAKEITNYFNVEFSNNVLFRIKKTKPQIKLNKEERKENIKESFLVRENKIIKNKTIFLVDDVFTTGFTMEEAAKALKIAGAKSVYGIVIARE